MNAFPPKTQQTANTLNKVTAPMSSVANKARSVLPSTRPSGLALHAISSGPGKQAVKQGAGQMRTTVGGGINRMGMKAKSTLSAANSKFPMKPKPMTPIAKDSPASPDVGTQGGMLKPVKARRKKRAAS